MNEELNIPIYRAKKIDSDEYVKGYYVLDEDDKHLMQTGKYESYGNGYSLTQTEIDPSTLAIHFPDMIDSEGTKIFASLSEDGKGGDVIEIQEHYEGDFLQKTQSFTVQIEQGGYNFELTDVSNYGVKVTGIQE